MSVAANGGAGRGGAHRGRRPPSIEGLERFAFVGEGGGAVVWRAWETAFNRPVAVKLLTRYDDERALSRFDSECLAVGSLAHPNIVSVHRTGKTEDTGSPFLQMEYLPKGSLADAIQRSGRMNWRDALVIAVKLAGALATAHDRSVLHRDIKPENVLLSPLDEPKLADFGIARVLGQTLSKTALSELTPDHATPEMARLLIGTAPATKSTASVEADIYCLASTLFTVLNGQPPFTVEDDNPIALLHRIPVQPLPNLRPLGVPSVVCEVIERGMAKEPGDRQPSALEFGEQLREAEARLGVPLTTLPFIPAAQWDEPVERDPSPSTARPVAVAPPTAPVRRDPPVTPVSSVPPEPVRPAPSTAHVAPPADPPTRPLPVTRPEPPPYGRRRLVAGLVAVAFLAVVGAAWAALVPRGADDPSPPQATTTSSSASDGSVTTTAAPDSTPVTTVPGPPAGLPASGTVAPGRYVSTSFVPKVTLTLAEGWKVEDGSSSERIVLSRSEPTETVTIMRVQRVYRTGQPLTTREEALNAVQDVRDLPNGLADWLLAHPQRQGPAGGITETRTKSGDRVGKRVDAQFAPYNYEGCETADNRCVPLFQIYGPDAQTFAFARVQAERIRFDIYDVDDAKVVVATSALAPRFDAFVGNLPLSVDQFEIGSRVSVLRVESTPNPSRENERVSLTATVSGPCTDGRVVFSNVPTSGPRRPLGSAGVANGRATLRDQVTFDARGQSRIVAEYDGSDCTRSISAPVIHRVN